MEIVYLYDPPDDGNDEVKWAIANCPSFISCIVTDISDINYYCDIIVEFSFGDKQDAVYFALTWKD